MKCRSLLLLACMLVVPLLAMFSHRIPADVRAAMRRGLRDSLGHCLGRPAEAGGTAPASTPVVATQWAAGNDFVIGSGDAKPGDDSVTSGSQSPAEPAETAVVPPALVAQLADRSRQARGQQSLESRLKDLGVVAFDCQPLPGNEGLHSSSCRVPVDASGQLQRVFQATGPDPIAASENLLLQVAAWRQRAASQLPATGRTASQPTATRFR